MHLASKRAMNKRLLKTSITGGAVVSRTFELPVLRSLLDEHHLSTIDSISLTNNTIQTFINHCKLNFTYLW